MSLSIGVRRAALPAIRTSPRLCSARKPISAFMAQSRRHIATRPLPEDNPDDVIFGSTYGLRTIDLNREKKLNSLNGSMARKIIPRLEEWSKSDLANVIMIKGRGRAFCAGGDVAELAQWNTTGKEGQERSRDYFATEYVLDHQIATFKKPYIAFMDGITMGGGVGLSVHAPFRIATENTLFAMPETTIGFFPDVGASFFLPRMDGHLGTYLALTSEQLKGVDVYYNGIATHYLHSSSLPDLEGRLGELNFKDYASPAERNDIVSSTIDEFATGLPSPPTALTGKLRNVIDSCFGHRSISEIIAALENVKSNDASLANWASKTIDTIGQRSPTSVSVALRQMQAGREWNIAETFQKEFSIASKFMAHSDFVEGVTAKLVHRKKERPNWAPNTLEQVRAADIDAFFDNNSDSLPLLNDDKYNEYPHRFLGLPTEVEIEAQLKKRGNSPETVLKHFIEQRNGKQGVKEKLMEYFERKGMAIPEANL